MLKINAAEKLTEDEVVVLVKKHLKIKGWKINSSCVGQEKGNDIVASMNGKTLIIEAKGAKANDKSSNKRRKQFSSEQIKNHLGKAIVKILEQMTIHPNFNFAIARPDDLDLRKHTEILIPYLKKLDIKHFWVSADGNIKEE
jgi:hypothetical protein